MSIPNANQIDVIEYTPLVLESIHPDHVVAAEERLVAIREERVIRFAAQDERLESLAKLNKARQAVAKALAEIKAL